MTICSYISDITWDMMSDAGIDIDFVDLRPTPDGDDEYIMIIGDIKIAFGPATTEQGNPAIGWEISTYGRDYDDDGSYWEHIRQESAQTPNEALRLVAAAVA